MLQLSQSKEIKHSYVEDGPMQDKENQKPAEDFGTYFNVVFIAQPESTDPWNTLTTTVIENGCYKQGIYW